MALYTYKVFLEMEIEGEGDTPYEGLLNAQRELPSDCNVHTNTLVAIDGKDPPPGTQY